MPVFFSFPTIFPGFVPDCFCVLGSLREISFSRKWGIICKAQIMTPHTSIAKIYVERFSAYNMRAAIFRKFFVYKRNIIRMMCIVIKKIKY